MSDPFSSLTGMDEVCQVRLQPIFDAEIQTPEVVRYLEGRVPGICDILSRLRDSIPLPVHSGVGSVGPSGFFRIPNHYRSVSLILSSSQPGGSSPGVLVIKGSEPLIPDFPEYFSWMLSAPFRASTLPIGLHFPLEMKLPPAAMWVHECLAEQNTGSQIQQEFLARHGHLARLPAPLFVFKLSQEQTRAYEDVIRTRLPADAMWKIRNKLAEGLGVEVYYYPELPVRVADLFVGNVRETFKSALSYERVRSTFESWASLLAELLCIGYMPYVPWHQGMGGCCDTGNACIDGGFQDLLTLVPFDVFPSDALYRQSLLASIRMLSDSMTSLAAASVGVPSSSDSDVLFLTSTFITERVRQRIAMAERAGHRLDRRLRGFCESPSTGVILDVIRQSHQSRSMPTQYAGAASIRRDASGASFLPRVSERR